MKGNRNHWRNDPWCHSICYPQDLVGLGTDNRFSQHAPLTDVILGGILLGLISSSVLLPSLSGHASPSFR